ncbi:colicin immunity domain-containing protein [Richelia sinica]|nr:colicin immunity domain-containing protein [Richelia sinica]
MSINVYINLIKDFVSRTISANEFEKKFIQMFKVENNFSSKKQFNILDKLFADVDAYCSDSDLIEDPEFDITEEELRLSAKEALNQLEELASV